MRTFLTILFACCCISAAAATPVEKHGELRVVDARLVGEDGSPAILHGVSMGWHSFWPRWYNPDAVAEVVNVWGADVVRAAIGVHPRRTGYLADPEGSWRCLEGVVEGALAVGAYVIVDWHSHAIETDAAVEFFTRVAERWGKHPNLIYEIYNEPINDSWDDVKAYSRTVIDAIRAIDPKGIILVGSPHWDQDLHIVAAAPLTGYEDIMYTMHFYAATHKDELRDRTQAAIDAGIPVFLSECAAMEATGDGPLDFESWRKWEQLADRNGLSWVTWSLSEKAETCSMILDGTVPATGGWRDADLKEWGRYVRDRLQAGHTLLPDHDVIATRDGGELRINFFGHGSIGFEWRGMSCYVDPVSDYADYSTLPKATVIMLTHEHGDHLDAKAIEALSTPETIILGNATAIEALGRGRVLAHGEVVESASESVEAVPAYNTSPDKQNFHAKARKHNGYVFTFGGTRIYVAGDTEPTPEMEALSDIDIAFLPVNLPFTMTEEQAALAALAFKPQIFYPYHYGGTGHKTDLDKLEKLLKGSGIEIRIRPLE